MAEKNVAQNRRARRDYHVLERFEAGIELRGTEVKSLRAGNITLKDSYADIEDGEVYLIGTHINPYEQGNIYNHDPERKRRLLMHKRETLRLGAQIAEKGFTLIPLRVYFKRGRAKVELGLCRGKHAVDKRVAIRERDIQRDTERALRDAKRR
ncbi:MAG TPA: SsrA-binding protein SmpB [Candidatus Hydrogenedentes bacterium]|nr:SsrA-binding protein SmpB [Candidatus Hydrogenedentota bacterium]